MGKLYLIILNMSSFFPYLTLQRRYLCFIHTLSTCIPHKIAELSTLMPYFISEKKRQIASPSPSNVVHPLSGIVLLSACLSFFRTVFSSVIYRFDYNILFSVSQGFLLDQIRHLMQNGTGPARKVSHKHTDRYSRLPETVPHGVSPAPSANRLGFSARISGKRSGRKYRPCTPRILS